MVNNKLEFTVVVVSGGVEVYKVFGVGKLEFVGACSFEWLADMIRKKNRMFYKKNKGAVL